MIATLSVLFPAADTMPVPPAGPTGTTAANHVYHWVAPLDFPTPVALDTGHPTFGTDWSSRRLQKTVDPHTGRSVLAGVCDCDLEVFDASLWHTVV